MSRRHACRCAAPRESALLAIFRFNHGAHEIQVSPRILSRMNMPMPSGNTPSRNAMRHPQECRVAHDDRKKRDDAGRQAAGRWPGRSADSRHIARASSCPQYSNAMRTAPPHSPPIARPRRRARKESGAFSGQRMPDLPVGRQQRTDQKETHAHHRQRQDQQGLAAPILSPK